MFQYHFSSYLVDQLLTFAGSRFQQAKKEVLIHQESTTFQTRISEKWYRFV